MSGRNVVGRVALKGTEGTGCQTEWTRALWSGLSVEVRGGAVWRQMEVKGL